VLFVIENIRLELFTEWRVKDWFLARCLEFCEGLEWRPLVEQKM